MLNKHEINSLVENIEWAKRDIEKGSVYHIKWAQKYASDVSGLLLELLKAYPPCKELDQLQDNLTNFLHFLGLKGVDL